MDTLFETFKKSGALHHAYCIECASGTRSAVVAALVKRIEEDLQVPTLGNPDFWQGEYDSLGIEEGRLLKELQANRAFAGGKKVFVVSANTLTREAQNSLLKVFEEPTPGTHFFLVMPSAESILPTLRSRLVMVEAFDSASTVRTKELSEPEQFAETFFAAPSGERMKIAKEIAERIADEELTRTDAMSFAVALIERTQLTFFGKKGDKVPSAEEAQILSELLQVRDYLGDRSASVKMLLEHMALLVPAGK